jgi:hypothetical protein
MCRSIKTLRGVEPPTEDDVRAAALQFVRKISGFREPSPANAPAFERAVEEITGVSRELLKALPRKRAVRPS